MTMEESLVNVEFLKSSNNFIARIQSELGGALLQDLVREGLGLGQEAVRGDDAIHQADPLRRRGVDPVPGVNHLRGPARADEAREPLARSESGDDADVDLRLAELRSDRRDPDVAGQGEFTAAA